MASIRRFRNDDPPQIAEIWNDACVGRGSYPLRSLSTLERCVFSKPYFDPAGLLIAEEGDEPVGFVHAGFGPNGDEMAADTTQGVICALAVRHAQRRLGIGSQLLRAAEDYVTTRGTRVIHVGAHWPRCPFYFGMYGGSNMPGCLESDAEAGMFLTHHGYLPLDAMTVLQRRLDVPVPASDARFPAMRKRLEVKLMPKMSIGSRWQECVYGLMEPAEFRLEDKTSGLPVARSLLWEMEGFGWRWGQQSAGFLDIQVRSDMRRQGVAKYLLSQILKRLQDECFGLVEVQIESTNTPALTLFGRLGFEQVDVGHVYQRSVD